MGCASGIGPRGGMNLPLRPHNIEECAVKTAVLFATLGFACVVPATPREERAVKVVEEWNATSADATDNDLWKKAPEGGVVAGPKQWAALWRAWFGGESVPKVDFDKEVILVVAGAGPNIIWVDDLALSDTGDLRFGWSITQRGGDGYVAAVRKVSRDGIRFVNGKALPSE